jgi:hypothetical protein
MLNGLADRVSARRVAYQRFTVLWITHWSYGTGRSDSARDFVTRVQHQPRFRIETTWAGRRSRSTRAPRFWALRTACPHRGDRG